MAIEISKEDVSLFHKELRDAWNGQPDTYCESVRIAIQYLFNKKLDPLGELAEVQAKLDIAIQQLKIIKTYTAEFNPHKQAVEALIQLGVL